MPKLIIQSQNQEWAHDLVPGSNIIGRASQCTVPIKDPSLSRQHCEIVLDGPAARLVDKGSMNGTLLNGKKIAEHPLKPGDRVTIGSVTLWFEVKGNPPTGKLPTAQAAEPVAPNASTRRAAVTPAPVPFDVPATGAPRPEARAAAESYLADFTFRGNAGGGAGKIVAALVALALLGAGAWFARGLFSSGPSVKQDTDSLVPHGSFDVPTGRPDGWQLRLAAGTGPVEKAAGSLSLDPTHGRGGGPCLSIEKAPGPADASIECAWTGDLSVPGLGAVEASGQVRFEGFSGFAAVKVEWFRGPRTPPALEEFSRLATKCADWTPVGGRFVPPAGSTAFRVGFAFLGRGGRIYLDDVRVTAGPSSEGPAAGLSVGPHKVFLSEQGVLDLEIRGKRPLLDVGLRLESDKEGAVWQPWGTREPPALKEKQLAFKGRLPNPGDLRDLEYITQIEAGDSTLDLFASFAPDLLRQVDRVTLGVTLPRSGVILGIPDAADKTTLAVTATSEEGDLILDFLEPARVRTRTVEGRTRLLATFKVDPTANPAQFGFTVREGGASSAGGGDPIRRAQDLEKKREFGPAMEAFKAALERLKDPAQREKLQKEIARLQAAEKRDWIDVQSHFFEAWISRRGEAVSRARDTLERYEREWRTADGATKAQAIREEDKRQATATPDPETERSRRVLDRAKKDAQEGRKALAQVLLQFFLKRWPQSEGAKEADELLKTLGM